MQKAALLYSQELSRFDFGMDHPFKPIRAEKTLELCDRYNLIEKDTILLPGEASYEDLCDFHTVTFVEILKKIEQGTIEPSMTKYGFGTNDNPFLPNLFKWCKETTGGILTALSLFENGYNRVFNLLGGFHHSGPEMAEGFCYVNDICVGILKALKMGIKRIAYVDIDAHHGNGVQDAFYKDDRVLVISIHETGRMLYPWSGFETEMGEGIGKGFNLNIPLEPGADDEVYEEAFDRIVQPVLEAFKPELMVAQLGADTLISDPLTHLRLTNNCYRSVVKKLVKDSPLFIGLGGGGYDVYRTSRCWTLAWSEISGIKPTDLYAGLIGGMMFGPEMEMGSLYDRPFLSKGMIKENSKKEAERVCDFLEKNFLPLWGLD